MISLQFLEDFLVLFILLIVVPSSYCDSDCLESFDCGSLQNLYDPFWRDGESESCGYKGFNLSCQEREHPIINIDEQDFWVLSLNQSINQMTIARVDLWDDICPPNFRNTTLNPALFSYVPDFYERYGNLSLFYDCSNQLSSSNTNKFPCTVNGKTRDAFYGFDWSLSQWSQDINKCGIRVDVPVPRTPQQQPIRVVIRQGFNVSYQDCFSCVHKDGGLCRSDSKTRVFTCFSHPPDDGQNLPVKLGIGFGAAIGSVLIMCIIFFMYLRRKKDPYAPSSFVSQSHTSDFSSRSDIERGINYGIQLFTYQQLEEATNNFDSKQELGEGGFGTVYYGKLRDGRAVAVKRLYENNYKRVEQFMNEVELLTRLRHPHLVSLYGCTSRHSRELLLVYEYIPNGTVADHLHGERAKPDALPWLNRMNIAVETATGLAYLHASDIIHRDVKTNNILLDQNCCVKVADFGLSRLFPLHVTHVSTAPQGTPGYVDPEYHECYQLTDKSDVYSFGVVLIELISSMPAVDITRHRQEINLSNMAINKIQNNALVELVDLSLGFNTDYAVRKMITAVAELAFQCLQSGKELRPSMDEVLETLKEIKNKDYNSEKKEEMDILSDEVGLLKSCLPPQSPDTVMIKWTSNSTTPNTSG